MMPSPLVAEVVWRIGPVPITQPVVVTWVIMIVAVAGAATLRRRLSVEQPGRVQLLAEIVVDTLSREIGASALVEPLALLPLLGTLFGYILVANLCGLLPGVHPPTAALETDAALGAVVFGSVVIYGVRARGPLGFLRSFASPTPLMLPLNLLESLTRMVSMTVRLFGNVMSGVFVTAIVLSLAGLLVPVPFMALEMLTGVIQAYIFTALTLVLIAGVAGASGD